MGIAGNERVYYAAFAALWKDVYDCLISYSDAYQYISQYVGDLWQHEWDMAVNNKLHSTKPLIRKQSYTYRFIHRDEVVLFRLKLGHTSTTPTLHNTLLSLDLWTYPAGVTVLLARWIEKLAGGPQAGRWDSLH